MIDLTEAEVKILKLSQVKEGDMMVVSSDNASHENLQQLRAAIYKVTGKKMVLVLVPSGDTIQLVEASEAKHILEHIAKGQP